MHISKSLLVGAALICAPVLVAAQDATGSISASLSMDPPVNGCAVTDPDIAIGTGTVGDGTSVVSGFVPLEVRCFGLTTPTSITITLGGTATATRAALSGPASSVIPYTLLAVVSNVNMDGAVGTVSSNLLAGMNITANPVDGSGATSLYSQNLRITAYPGHSEAVVLAPGSYTASSTVEINY